MASVVPYVGPRQEAASSYLLVLESLEAEAQEALSWDFLSVPSPGWGSMQSAGLCSQPCVLPQVPALPPHWFRTGSPISDPTHGFCSAWFWCL